MERRVRSHASGCTSEKNRMESWHIWGDSLVDCFASYCLCFYLQRQILHNVRAGHSRVFDFCLWNDWNLINRQNMEYGHRITINLFFFFLVKTDKVSVFSVLGGSGEGQCHHRWTRWHCQLLKTMCCNKDPLPNTWLTKYGVILEL